jgi:3-oxoacyl-[acyl-carrier protein] reductase
MRLEGKIAIVTGAGSGFGEGIAKKFVAEGARVLIADRDAAGGERVAKALGVNARSLRIDVTSAADVKRMFDAAHDFFGGLHIHVNNAGVAHAPQPLEGLPEDEFDHILAVNVKAIYLAAKELLGRARVEVGDGGFRVFGVGGAEGGEHHDGGRNEGEFHVGSSPEQG